MAFVACGDDENDYQIGEKKSTPNPVDTDPSQASGPEIAKYSLEFPALKGGNSIVLVHEATLNDKSGKSGVNFSIEWDTDKNTQHWTCYKMYDTTIAQLQQWLLHEKRTTAWSTNINSVNQSSGIKLIPLKYEMTEMALCGRTDCSHSIRLTSQLKKNVLPVAAML